MRPDQIVLLKELAERLADAFIAEAEPNDWPGAGKSPEDWSKGERGDRVWMKKNAIGTATVLRQTLDLVEREAPVGGAKPGEGPESGLDREIADAERRATEAVNRALSRAKKPGQAQGAGAS